MQIEDFPKLSLAWAWWVMANRQAKSILCLYDSGLGGDASPLVRSMIEHSLWLVGLARDDGPLLAAVFNEDDRRDKLLLKLLENASESKFPAELTAMINEMPPIALSDQAFDKTFTGLCTRLGVEQSIGTIWRMLSALSHPTPKMTYLLTNVRTNQAVTFTKESTIPGMDGKLLAQQAVALVVQCLTWAGYALDRVVGNDLLKSSLDVIAAEAHIRDL
jgi:hypothetical protein